MASPVSRKPSPDPPADGERELPPGRKRFDIDELLPPHDCGPWPEGLKLTREEMYEDPERLKLTRENGGIVSDRY